MSLYFLNFDVGSVKTARQQLAKCIPNAKRGHLAECVAAGLGFKSSIALQTYFRAQSLNASIVKRFDIDAFFSRLKAFGYEFNENNCASGCASVFTVLAQCHLASMLDESGSHIGVHIDATLSIGSAEIVAQLLVELVRQRNNESEMWVHRLSAMVHGVLRVLVEMRNMGVLPLTHETIVHYLSLPNLRALANDNRVCNTERLGLRRYLASLPGYAESDSVSVQTQSMHDYLTSKVQREISFLYSAV